MRPATERAGVPQARPGGRIEAEICELAAHLDAATHRFLALIREYGRSGSDEPPNVSAETHARPERPSRADVLVKLAELVLAGTVEDGVEPARTGDDRTTILVHVAKSALGEHHGAQLEDGTRVPAETLRRLSCDAGLVPIATDDHIVGVLM